MANPFDQFDAAPASGGANPFDQFDVMDHGAMFRLPRITGNAALPFGVLNVLPQLGVVRDPR
ncbi:MAG: hypothetical protein ACREFW_09195 [Rhizomicrobium sp.]